MLERAERVARRGARASKDMVVVFGRKRVKSTDENQLLCFTLQVIPPVSFYRVSLNIFKYPIPRTSTTDVRGGRGGA